MRREKGLRTRGVGDRRERKERVKPELMLILPEMQTAFLYKVLSFNRIQVPELERVLGVTYEKQSFFFSKMNKILFFCEVHSILNNLDSSSIHFLDNNVRTGKMRQGLTYSFTISVGKP